MGGQRLRGKCLRRAGGSPGIDRRNAVAETDTKHDGRRPPQERADDRTAPLPRDLPHKRRARRAVKGALQGGIVDAIGGQSLERVRMRGQP
jgi:hypothetical protein